MDCEEVRAALSARLDGEPSGHDDDVVDAHLDACDDCRAWFEKAVALNRSLLMGPAQGAATPDFSDLSERILSTVEPERRRRERTWFMVTGGARLLLVLLGVLHVWWGIEMLFSAGGLLEPIAEGAAGGAAGVGGGVGGAAEIEAIDDAAAPAVDAAALRLAFAVGMFWAAWRPRAAMGMAPVYGAAAMFSFGFATRELVLGSLRVVDVAGLLLMAVSALALVVVWLGAFTPAAMAQAWRAASGRPVRGFPDDPA